MGQANAEVAGLMLLLKLYDITLVNGNVKHTLVILL